jgi:acyl-CoA dehydrogenase
MTPLAFGRDAPPAGNGEEAYRRIPAVRQTLAFFQAKGLAALKEEDRRGGWYQDWLDYQKQHSIYAGVMAPQKYSSRGGRFDLLRYTRFLEVFAYLSAGHAYSVQVSFLGLFSILLGSNEALKHEAVGILEAGELLAFGVSEKGHGSDLLANEFTMTQTGEGHYVANGSKYYIGNANAAGMMSILGHKIRKGFADVGTPERLGRQPFMVMALRPDKSPAYGKVEKIQTLGARTGFVGSFEVSNHSFTQADVIAEGRDAWDAVFGTVTLGKFFLGFGSIGICEHAFHEVVGYLKKRVLYGKPVLDMPHIRLAMVQAYARLTAMKLYAYRALDYVHAASAKDRRYLLYCAVQKAKVSTEAVKVMALLHECVGAKGLEGDTYMEMALRDIQLFPGLEGSMHINLRQTTQFSPRYLKEFDRTLSHPPSLWSTDRNGEDVPENPYLMEAKTGHTRTIGFRPVLEAYRPLAEIPNVLLFARQTAAFCRLSNSMPMPEVVDSQIDLALGHCMATIAYGQLVAENAARTKMPREIVSVIFGLLVTDLGAYAMHVAGIPQFEKVNRALIMRLVRLPRTLSGDWDWVGQECGKLGEV